MSEYSDCDQDFERHGRGTAVTYNHQASTCQMGQYGLAVVDPRILKVRGLGGFL
ncbi:GMC oxidoreductase [Arthrobacter crystallopoietes]|uniref:GMC oxidoreductase n=1 Tax=Crystallibacter crystallopoietes TaxID=37928 RepID=UPI003D196B82